MLQAAGLKFAPAVGYGTGDYGADSVAVADVNGDGKPDLVVANVCVSNPCGGTNGMVGVLLGNGDGTFQTAVVYDSGGYDADSVALADVNGDGKLDLVVANKCTDNTCATHGTLGVLLGNGDGTFQAPVLYDSGGYGADSVAVADVNGDGKPDLLVASICSSGYGPSCTSDGGVGVLLGNGDGTFQAALVFDSGGGANSVAVADVNGDGKPDLVVANDCAGNVCDKFNPGTVGVLLGNGDGTFQAAVTYGSGGLNADSVAAVDVNGDGKPDLLVTNNCSDDNCEYDGSVGVLLGNGDGTFQTVVVYDSGGVYTDSVAAVDVSGDGKPDLVVVDTSTCCGTGMVGVLLGNGDGTFQTVVSYSSGGWQVFPSVAVVDVNGDGRPDIMVTNFCGSDPLCHSNATVGVLINTSVAATTTTVVSSLNPSNFGQPVIFTATVTSQGFNDTPTGTVNFFEGTMSIGNSSLNASGVATFTSSTLALGTHIITATYNGDTVFAPSTSPVLSQVVQGAIAQVSPTSFNFGSQTVGIVSTPQSAILMNTGNVPLTITSIGITGNNSGDFAQTNNCGTSVAAGGSCTITVTFTPAAAGTRNASVTIADNAPGSPQSVSLTGVGVVPVVTFSPTSLTFPTQVVFTTSAAKNVTLTNTGAGLLTISDIAATGQFTESNNCGTSIVPGGSCTISIKFKPAAIGILLGSVSVIDNASGSPQSISLTGTGTYLQLTPTSLNFGNQPIGTKSLPRRIAVSNKGSVAVSIKSISIKGANAGDFAETNTCGKSIAAGASCAITVTFAPSAGGKRTASVWVSDSGGGSPQKVGLVGTGT